MADANLGNQPTFRLAVQKPKFGVYYALLIIALGAMLTACLFCYLEIRRFGGFGAVKGRISSLERPAVLFHHGESEFTQGRSCNFTPCPLR